VLTVPDATNKGANHRLTVPSEMTYEDLLTLIHECIGCHAMAEKPQLQYKLTNVRTSDPILLMKAADWQGLKEDMTDAQKKKKDGITVGACIIVSDTVCLSIVCSNQCS